MAGRGLYIDFWKQILKQLVKEFKNGEINILLDVSQIEKLGGRDRSGYNGRLDIEFGRVTKYKDSAPFRDLKEVIRTDNSEFKFYSVHRLYIEVSKLEMKVRLYKGDVGILIKEYKKTVKKGNPKEIYKWELIEKFNGRPDTSVVDFGTEITSIDYKNLIFHNAVAVRNTLAKSIPEEYRKAFMLLFDENQSLSDRIFTFRAKIAELYRSQGYDLQSHHDERSIATFLAFKYPDRYALYKETIYLRFCRYKGILPKRVNEKYIHYLELIKSFIAEAIINDNELIQTVSAFKNAESYKDPKFLILAQDILYQVLDKGTDDENNEDNEDEFTDDSKNSMNFNFPKNQILYGPPGTGKTFHTVNKAIAIIEGKSEEEIEKEQRPELKRRFDTYVKEEQIVFTTFHQSLGYEDFVEGIKPLPPQSDDTFIKYEVVNGVFKNICNAARTPNHQGFRLAYISLQKELQEMEMLVLKTPQGKEYAISLNSNGNLSLHTGTSKKKQGVLTRDNIERQIKGEDIFGGWNGYFYGVIDYLKNKHNYAETRDTKNFVLIIDEINRGNVSQIFGELITLLEEDKREGAREAITVTLPYSKTKFSVPENVFILGTMNTADRSVEALDTALRRRFSFVEMLPDVNHESINDVDGIDLKQILYKMNLRLEKLVSRDHTIGHSFFLNLKNKEELYHAFYNKIIPLLQEYFFGDYGKIGLVLGSQFIIEEKSDSKIFADFEYEDKDLLLERKVYRINEFKNDINSFIDALRAM